MVDGQQLRSTRERWDRVYQLRLLVIPAFILMAVLRSWQFVVILGIALLAVGLWDLQRRWHRRAPW